MSEAGRKDLAALRPALVADGVGRAFLPFAVLQQLAAVTDPDAPMPPAGCEIVTAGEALQVNDALRAFARGLGGARLRNQYGPTETHVVSQFSLDCAAAEHWPELPPSANRSPMRGCMCWTVISTHCPWAYLVSCTSPVPAWPEATSISPD